MNEIMAMIQPNFTVGWLTLCLMLVVGVCLHAAWLHLFPGLRNRSERIHLIFSLLCFSLAGYTLGVLLLYHADTVPLAVVAGKICWTFGLLVSLLLVWFTRYYTGYVPLAMPLLVSAVFGALLIRNLVEPSGIIFRHITRIESMALPGGETLNFPVGKYAWYEIPIQINYGISFIYVIFACRYMYSRKSRKRAVRLFICLAVLYGASILEDIRPLYLDRHTHLSPFAFLLMVGLMGRQLLRELDVKMMEAAHSRFVRLEEGLGDNCFVFATKPNGVLTYITPKGHTKWKINPKVQIGTKWPQYFDAPASEIEYVLAQFAKGLKEKSFVTFTFSFNEPGVGKQYAEVRAWPVLNWRGQVEEFEGIFFDITQRKLLEERIKESRDKLAREVKIRTAELEATHERLLGEVQGRRDAEQFLKTSQKRYRAILEQQRELVGRCLPDGTITYVNSAICHYMSLQEQEIIGGSIFSYFLLEDQGILQQYFSALNDVQGAIVWEARLYTPGGKWRWQEWTIHAILDKDNILKEIQGVGRDITERKRLEKALSQITFEEQERISEELRNSIGKNLAGLHGHAMTLKNALEQKQADNASLAVAIGQGLQQTQAEVQHVIEGLTPVTAHEGGLEAALGQLLCQTQQQCCIEILFECPAPVHIANRTVADHVYRIVQESVNNAVKYARCTRLRVTLREEGETLFLQICDNGVGLAQVQTTGGMGLRIMRYRAEIMGGSLALGVSEAGGLCVQCTMPVQAQVLQS